VKAIVFCFCTLFPGQFILACDIDAGRQSGLAGGIMLSAPSATDMLACPTGDMCGYKILFETGFQRKFELSDLDKAFISAGYGFGRLDLAVGYSQFGECGYYVERLLKSGATIRLGRAAISAQLSLKKIEIGAEDERLDLHALSSAVAAGLNSSPYHIGIMIDNINRPRPEKNSVKDNAQYKMYGEIEGLSRFSITGYMAFEERQRPVFSIGQYIRPAEGGAVFWGVSDNPTIYGGGLEINCAGLWLMYAVSFHPVLGFTHNVSISYHKMKSPCNEGR
jgi:hypothetical protein